MPRPGAQAAEELLYEICRKHGTDPKSVRERVRWRYLIKAKREFCMVAVNDHGMQLIMVAEVLGLHHTTVLHHASEKMRARKRQTRTRGTANG